MTLFKTILIVEDDYMIGLDIQAILSDAGFSSIGPIGSSQDALQSIATHRMDAALVDGNLNGQSSMAVAVSLVEHGIPFGFVTGYGRESLPAAFHAVPMLGKPFDAAALVRMVNRLIEPRGMSAG